MEFAFKIWNKELIRHEWIPETVVWAAILTGKNVPVCLIKRHVLHTIIFWAVRLTGFIAFTLNLLGASQWNVSIAAIWGALRPSKCPQNITGRIYTSALYSYAVIEGKFHILKILYYSNFFGIDPLLRQTERTQIRLRWCAVWLECSLFAYIIRHFMSLLRY